VSTVCCFGVIMNIIASTRKPVPVSVTSDMQFGTEFFWSRFSVANRTMLYFHAGLWSRFSGTGFRCRFVVLYVIGIKRGCLQVRENIAAGALVAHMTVSDLDSGSQGHVECRLESNDEVTMNSFSLHRYQPRSDHFRSVCHRLTTVNNLSLVYSAVWSA